MRFFVLPLLLAAAASAEVFQFVGQHGHGSTVYGVRGAVTVGVHQLTGEKSALEYNGTLALQQVQEGVYLAKFTNFTVGKYEKIDRTVNDETFGDLTPEERRHAKVVLEQGGYEHEMTKPVRFHMMNGQVVRVEAGKEHQQWSLNIFRSVFTLLQNQIQKPTNLAVPYVEYKYEDGVTGNCRVQYNVYSQPAYGGVVEGVFNVTKTKNYKDCFGRPVYQHLKDVQRGCAGVCDNHRPENFLGKYEEEYTDFETKPTPGCPVHQQRKDSLVTVQSVTKYNVSKGFLDEARSEHTDIYHLYGGRVQVFTTLYVFHYHGVQGPKIEEPTTVETYETLQHRLPREEDELDIPVYALLKEHTKHQQYVQYFTKHFDAVVHELRTVQTHQKQGKGEQQAFDAPAYIVGLLQAVSSFTEKELRETIPAVVRHQQPKQLGEEEQIRRQLWIELLGKAGTKAAIKVAVEFIKNHTFTPTETRRVLQDIAAFQSYPDTEVVEQLLGLCIVGHGQDKTLTPTGKATACVAAGKVISKACNSKVYQWAQKQEHQKRFTGKTPVPTGHATFEVESESEEYHLTFGHFPVKAEHFCTPEKLQQYVDRLYQALKQATEFKQIVAYINGLAKIQKPEVLPKLIEYVEGTAENLKHIKQHGEEEHETVEFIRRVAIVALQTVAVKYPKEVNPIVRVIYFNTTEQVQTRIVAFDVWTYTQPAQWEIEKVMQVANKDTSLELTHYVYTTLKTILTAQEPCHKMLAERVYAAWTHIHPLDLGLEFSHLRSTAYYNTVENYGIRGIWKFIASNTTFLPTFGEVKYQQTHGPYIKTFLGAKLLVKGTEKFWEQIVGQNGIFESMSRVFGNQPTGTQQEAQRMFKDIAQGMNMKQYHEETPKAVLFWHAFAGEAVIPIDAEYLKELKQELFHTVTKLGQQGVTGHYFRIFVPTRSFHVEPTTIGFPVVHSTIHPIVVSVRYENVKVHYGSEQGRVTPYTFQVTGTFHPTVLSFRQVRVFLGEKEGHQTPTVRVTDVKEFTTRFSFHFGFSQPEHRVTFHVKPVFDRVFHSGHCTEIQLQTNTIVAEHPLAVVDYGKCVKSLYVPVYRHEQLNGLWTGMTLRLAGETHQPSGLPIFGTKDIVREGVLGAMINRFANKDLKHHAISLYLEADKQEPINEWVATIDLDSNLHLLAKIPTTEQVQKIHKIKAEYMTRQHPINGELQQVLGKIETLLKQIPQIEETTVEKQMLIKIQGLYQGQPKRTINVAMKRIFNFDKTEQQFVLAAEHKETNKGLELLANVSYPKVGSIFRFDPTYFAEDERANATLTAKFYGQEEQIYRVNFEAIKSEEQKQESEYEWFEVRCLAEQKAGRTMTDACRMAILKHNALDAMHMTVELPRNVHPMVKAVAYKTLDMIKYKYFPKMETEVAGRHEAHRMLKTPTGETEIHLYANATRVSPWTLLYNVRIEMPLENVTLSQIRVPGLYPVHMQLTPRQQIEEVIFHGQTPSYCVLGDKYIHTYDNVTFGLDVKPGCEYVLTRDVTGGKPNFTVTFEVVKPETFAKKVRVQFYTTLVEFEPFTTTDRFFTVTVNGTQHQITFGKPFVFAYGFGKHAEVKAVETAHPHHYNLVALYTETNEFGFEFDGHSARTFVDYKYKGQVNGICGNNDNEQTHEFVGPQGHEYQHANEFIASYGLGQGCSVPVENTNEKLMTLFNQEMEQLRRTELLKKDKLRREMHEQYTPRSGKMNPSEQELNKFWAEQQEEHLWGKREQPETMQYENVQEDRQVLKTAVSIENGHICFSATPVAACRPGFKNEGVLRTERVESVCLERNNEAAMTALQQVRAGEIVNIATLESYQKGRLFTIHNVPKCERDY